jgi:cation diffusion facilitator family transporter
MEERNKKATLVVIILTLITMVAEIAVGYLSGSMALLADGWHMGTHTLALSLAYSAYLMIDYFEHKRIAVNKEKVKTLAGYTSAVFLSAAGLAVLVESVMRVIEPEDISFNEAIIVAFVGLSVNGVCLFVMKDHHNHSEEHTHKEKDYNFKSAYLHIMADVLTSVLAIMALFGAKYSGFTCLDSVMGILGGLIILKWSFGILRDTFKILTDAESAAKV